MVSKLFKIFKRSSWISLLISGIPEFQITSAVLLIAASFNGILQYLSINALTNLSTERYGAQLFSNVEVFSDDLGALPSISLMK